MRGNSVLLVDDCCESRDALQLCLYLLCQTGARVIACAVTWKSAETTCESFPPVIALCDGVPGSAAI